MTSITQTGNVKLSVQAKSDTTNTANIAAATNGANHPNLLLYADGDLWLRPGTTAAVTERTGTVFAYTDGGFLGAINRLSLGMRF